MNDMRLTLDRLEVADVVIGFANALDDREWTAFRSLLADRVHVDTSRHSGAPPGAPTAAELTASSRRALEGFTATQHALSNLVVRVDGDTAWCRAGITAYHYLPTEPGIPEYCLMRGRWEVSLRRTAGSWRIESMVVVRTTPLEGYPGLYHAAPGAAPPGGSEASAPGFGAE